MSLLEDARRWRRRKIKSYVDVCPLCRGSSVRRIRTYVNGRAMQRPMSLKNVPSRRGDIASGAAYTMGRIKCRFLSEKLPCQVNADASLSDGGCCSASCWLRRRWPRKTGRSSAEPRATSNPATPVCRRSGRPSDVLWKTDLGGVGQSSPMRLGRSHLSDDERGNRRQSRAALARSQSGRWQNRVEKTRRHRAGRRFAQDEHLGDADLRDRRRSHRRRFSAPAVCTGSTTRATSCGRSRAW